MKLAMCHVGNSYCFRVYGISFQRRRLLRQLLLHFLETKQIDFMTGTALLKNRNELPNSILKTGQKKLRHLVPVGCHIRCVTQCTQQSHGRP
jgi:hypothetical protein